MVGFFLYNVYPRCSMYGIFTYIWLIFMVHVGKYTVYIEFLGIFVVHLFTKLFPEDILIDIDDIC